MLCLFGTLWCYIFSPFPSAKQAGPSEGSSGAHPSEPLHLFRWFYPVLDEDCLLPCSNLLDSVILSLTKSSKKQHLSYHKAYVFSF